MKRTKLLSLCGLLFTVLCVSVFLNSCKKDDDGPSKKPELDLYEPNDVITEASPVTFNTKVKASLHNKDDVDFYKFSGTASGKIDILKFELSNGSTDANFTITIYAKNKEEIVQVPYAGNGIDLDYQMVTGEAEFYVKVSGKDASVYPANYTLTVGFANVADKYEPNDDIATAAVFPFNTVETLNLLTGDIDFFKIQDLSTENIWDAYEVKLVNKTTDMSPAIRFYDENKTEIEELGIIVDKGKDITKQFFMKSGASNARYLEIYTIAPFATMPAGYTLEVVKKNANEASEPNDTWDTAQEITDGTYQGTIVKGGSNPANSDIDFVKISIPAGKRLKYRILGENVKYDYYYNFYGPGEPSIWYEDRSSSSVWTTSSFSGSSVYVYFALKSAVDLAQWTVEFELVD